MKGIIFNALRYTASNWYNVLILGLLLFLADHLVDLSSPSIIGGISDILILITVIFLSFMELGYGFRIVEETVKGSFKPPSFSHPLNIFWHGVKESVILLFYYIVPLILIIIVVSEFETLLRLDLSPLIVEYFLLILIILLVTFNIMFQGAVLNMAHHEGRIISGLNLPMVFRKIRLVGFKNMLIVSVITTLVIYIVKQAIFDTLHELPYLGPSVGDFISTVLIAPFLMIFTTRLLGLIDVDDDLD